MTLHVALTHRTSYAYDRPVMLGPQTIRLRPAPHARTAIVSYALRVEPAGHFLNWQQDPQGNFLARVVFPERVIRFEVTVDLVADMTTVNPFDFFLEPDAETYPFAYDPNLAQELAPYRRLDDAGPLLAALVDEVRATQLAGTPRTIDLLVAINRLVQSRVAYIVRLEAGVLTPEETLGDGRGSCRDSAWLLVLLLRHLGFAARFVSGYLIQLAADIVPLEGPAGPTSDFTDLHAWAEVYLPGAGWVGLDATSGLLTAEGHIPLAASPDPVSAAPITGGVETAEVTFDFEMKVARIVETPRVTKPYDDRQWQDILAMGTRVDRALAAGQVRLTMGGEPTFVSANDMEGAEWTTDALGPTKRRYAERLMRRLAPTWSPGSALQSVLGKHYPGEQLPRWALLSHWRRDNEPVWRDPGLFASGDETHGATAADAARFAVALAERLQVPPDLVNPAYEDIHYYLWKEDRLPANVIAEDSKLRDPAERARLARVFGQGLHASVGSVLPLRRVASNGTRRWQSGKWFFRPGVMYLIPGDAPVGFRLPLTALPWADPSRIEQPADPDPFAPLAPLPPADRRLRMATGSAFPASWDGAPPGPMPQDPSFDHRAFGLAPGSGGGTANGHANGHTNARPEIGREEPDLVRTALAVEARGGTLHVFFPPLYAAEDWLDLAAAIEDTAAELGMPVVLEGYPPPRDPRLNSFSITPDPGVIEVNIHPAASWPEMVERTTQLYEEARAVGLAAQKFMLDGRHTGTGGGNHVVMGAATPADSPFLRRPDLLKSLLGFWHNHPSLSYLFSGLFIGPTSQHPRVDEARQDSLHELEIAFSRISAFRETPPWLTDRLFRNILADLTGNTHRTEFCIDKMYAPESATGRLGLVEFRALEMPPDSRMSMAQMLLMRAAVAAFWQMPYERRLVRWGTRLHDDFMLPHYVALDFNDALEELAQLGFRLDPAWFAPHLAFRFPKIGEVSAHGVTLELHHALEPWHVLGEEPAAGGTVRYVDSSSERVQARVSGWSPERYVLACNGCAVPLTRTDTVGAYVGAVRFKAWNPPSSLHPTVRAQSPLVFDIWDRWSGRSLGGLTHHVSHPGGRSYDTFPVNALEAEARRRARFFPFGHTPGPSDEPRVLANHEHPRTLDLRQA
jgi:uncharacterized protein (DUF2126 family)/transglutaminase-like putative cysteine protease